MSKQLINPASLYDMAPFGASQAVVDGESSLVFVSGQVAWDMGHQVASDSMSEQFKSALKNLETALQESGASVGSLLQVRIYLRGEFEDHMEAIAPLLAEFLGASRPAVTGVGVASLASKTTLVEVEAVARVE